ncbi:MAG: glycosyltransferase family 2 protein [Phycisphaeraceae bacterium]|nr:glycosyltransferase family 2 protein [Phycisphaeraceae bacterium]
MKLLIVIVNYKVTSLTIDCLRSLAPQMPGLPGVKVAVCENGTGPEAVAELKQTIASEGWSSWVDLTAINPNRGFTGGNNAVILPALKQPDVPEYFLLLNADTLVHTNAIRALIDFMDQNPSVGIAGSRLEDPDGSPQISAFRFQSILSEFDRGLRLGVVSRLLKRWQVAPPVPTEACPAQWVSGASLIVRQEIMEKLRGLDEDYFTYFDDIDICFNARKLGWPTWYVPASRVVHLVGQTTGIDCKDRNNRRQPQYWFEARRRYFLKNHGPFYAALADAAFILGFALWRLRRLVTRKPDPDPQKMLWDAIRQSVFLKGFAIRPVGNPAMNARPRK